MGSIPPIGLYRPEFEHDACGVSFVVDMHGRRRHDIVRMGLDSLCHLEHRGASGAEVNTGDGAGILCRSPTASTAPWPASSCPKWGPMPQASPFFPPTRPAPVGPARSRSWPPRAAVGHRLARVPTDPSPIGSIARSAMPSFNQVFVAGPSASLGLDLERRVFILRKRIEHELNGIYFPSLSARTVIYKGMLTAPQVQAFFRTWATSVWTARWPWSTPAFRPIPSRAGLSPTRTVTSPTTVRSTPCKATATGCGPGRRCSPVTCSRATWSGSSRSSRPEPATRPASTRCWSWSTWAAVRCRTQC